MVALSFRNTPGLFSVGRPSLVDQMTHQMLPLPVPAILILAFVLIWGSLELLLEKKNLEFKGNLDQGEEEAS